MPDVLKLGETFNIHHMDALDWVVMERVPVQYIEAVEKYLGEQNA